MGGAYRGPTGGSGGGSLPKPPPLPRRGADIDETVFNSMNRYDEARAREAIKSSISRAPKIDKFAAAPIGMGAAAGAGVVAKKRKDAEKTEAYKRKPRMADAPPKINIRKAYEE